MLDLTFAIHLQQDSEKVTFFGQRLVVKYI